MTFLDPWPLSKYQVSFKKLLLAQQENQLVLDYHTGLFSNPTDNINFAQLFSHTFSCISRTFCALANKSSSAASSFVLAALAKKSKEGQI